MNILPHRSFYNPVEFNGIKKLFGLIDFVIKDAFFALIEQWLKNKDTVLFLGVWEQLNNPNFNSLEFEGIRNEAGRNSFYLSAKKWMDATTARLSKAPTERPYDSPGQRPGSNVPMESGALKGRNNGGGA